MLAWRIARKPFADLDGLGASMVGGRWNSPGRPVVYLSAEPSLALLEVRAHLDLPFELLPEDYVYMEVTLADLDVKDALLPETDSECRRIGDDWLASLETPLLRVPSVIVPFSSNILLNPSHPDAHKAAILSITPVKFDARLWSSGR